MMNMRKRTMIAVITGTAIMRMCSMWKQNGAKYGHS